MSKKKEVVDGKICCNGCGEWKEWATNNFYQKGTTLDAICTDCRTEYARKYRANSTEEKKARKRESNRKSYAKKKVKEKGEWVEEKIDIVDNCKKCIKCGEWKEINDDNFKPNGYGHSAKCRECQNKEARIYRENNPMTEDQKKRSNELNKQWRQNNKDKARELKRQWRAKNREKENAKYNQRIKDDVIFRLREMISKKIRNALKSKGSSKNGKSMADFLPYTVDELKSHLESLFEPWMTWENHGTHRKWIDDDPTTWRWHVDHIMPQSDLPFISMEDESFKKCWALKNLRPLSSRENMSDGGTRIRHKSNDGINQHNNDAGLGSNNDEEAISSHKDVMTTQQMTKDQQ